MKAILFVKTSSLGDIIHQMPAVSEARHHFPDTHLAWVVEEMYAPIARLNPAFDELIVVATRRWRKHLLSAQAWHEVRRAVRTLRARRYDAIIDTQGLVRSAVIAKLAHGPRHGYDARDARESFAARFYDVTHRVGRDVHVVARNRELVGRALGYVPQGEPDFGLTPPTASRERREAFLLHATARLSKEWPEAGWIALGRAVAERGYEVVIPWGNARERARAERLAAAIPGSQVLPPYSLEQLTLRIAKAALVVGVDTGFLHIAAAYGVPCLGIYVASPHDQARPAGPGPVRAVGSINGPPAPAEAIATLDALMQDRRNA